MWRSWCGDATIGLDLDGKPLPDLTSSTESLKLARHTDGRGSGKSNKSTGSGYLTMSCLKHEPSEDSDASADRPARPPKPPRMSPPADQYVDMEPRPPERRPRVEREHRCTEYELMSDFMSHARACPPDAPPVVPPRTPHRRLTKSRTANEDANANSTAVTSDVKNCNSTADDAKFDTISNDDSLLDELRKDTYCVLKVCEDDESTRDITTDSREEVHNDTKEDYGIFSRISIQRKSNPCKSQSSSYKPLKTSNSASNVNEALTHTSRPIAERFTPFFLKKKSKPPDDSRSAGKCPKKEENLIGRLTPRFGQSRLYGRGQSLELNPPAESARRIERSATSVSIPARHMDSSVVAKMRFMSLHRYGAQPTATVQCRSFTPRDEYEPAVTAAPAPDSVHIKKVLEYVSGEVPGEVYAAVRDPLSLPPLIANNDIRL